jgi:flagellar biosynthetic protein FliP
MRRAIGLILVVLVTASISAPAPAQVGPLAGEGITPPTVASPMSTPSSANGAVSSPSEMLNPARVLEDAADAIPGFDGGLSSALNVVLLLTVLGLAPSIILMTTSFLRIVVVLSLLKQAIGAQNLPPSQVVLGLSLFMTLLVMSPTIDRVYQEAIIPYNNGEITNQLEMWDKAKQPVRDFMFDQIEATGNWSSLYMIMNYRGQDTSAPEKLTRADVDTITLVPAYMLSELKVAFLMGFRVYLPFLVIDVVIASLLISMSMMMLPPVLISLPFKLLLFVLVDGWTLVVGSLMSSFVREGGAERLSNLVATGGP